MRCAFLTTDDLTGYVTDDHTAIEVLGRRGHDVRAVSWRDDAVDWSRFDGVVIRSPWDYHRDPWRFLNRLDQIAGRTRVANTPEVVRWNLRKTYLRELARAGADIPETVWLDSLAPGSIETLFDSPGTDQLVVKPVIGASADGVFRLRRGDASGREGEIVWALRGRPVMAQPFLESVIEDGEWAVVYLGGEQSHTVHKRAAPGEYRVQEEQGGSVRPTDGDPALLAAAERAVACTPVSLYARVDCLRHPDGRWLVSELELIEPALYLRADDRAPTRFADAIEAWLA